MADNIPNDWNIKSIDECMENIIDYRGKTPRKTTFGIPLITAKIVKDGRINTPDEFIDPENFDSWMTRGLPQVGDVIMTTEAPLGEIAQLDKSKVALAQRLILLRGRKGILDNSFLKFLMQSEFIQSQLYARATGTTVLGIKQSELRKVNLLLPPLPEQLAIAHILGTLDDKIELNRRRNETLEQMARAIFKSWFVDFDPVRAKAEGRDAGLPKHIADLFPDEFEESELGRVPKGWSHSKIGKHFYLTMGQSPPGSTYNETGEGIPFYQGRTDFGFRFPSRRVFCTAPTRFAETGDSLVSVRAPVGDVNMASERCAVGRGIAVIRHCSGSRSITYYSMRNLSDHFGKFEAEGTVFGSINKNDFERLPFTVSLPEVFMLFDRIVSPFDDRIEINQCQISILACLCDSLLSKLISGELPIQDAERIVRRAV